MRPARSIASLFVMLATATSPALAGESKPEQIARIVSEYVEAGHFQGQVLVAEKGEVIFERSYGLASLEKNAPFNERSTFRLASISKQFVATAILRLQEEGKLSVHDKARAILPEMPEAWDAVTVRQLVSHTSGVPSYSDIPDYYDTASLPRPPEAIIARVRDLPLRFAPGTQFHYSNSNYVLLGMILEKVTGESFPALMSRLIFAPAGLKETSIASVEQILPGRVDGYVKSKADPKVLENAMYNHPSSSYAAGNVYSTARDLLKWDRVLREGALLSPATTEALFTEVMGGYGYGWDLGVFGERRFAYHGGSIHGQLHYFYRGLEDDVTIVVLGTIELSPIKEMPKRIARVMVGAREPRGRSRDTVVAAPRLDEGR